MTRPDSRAEATGELRVCTLLRGHDGLCNNGSLDDEIHPDICGMMRHVKAPKADGGAEGAALSDVVVLSDDDLHRIAIRLSDEPSWDDAVRLFAEVHRLRDRERRLVAALRSISTLVVGEHTDAGFNRSNLCEAVSTARAALDEGGGQ